MARLRKGNCYRALERPYTRISKYRKKSYVRTRPNLKIVRFDMGEPNKKFPYTVLLKSRNNLQIRHNALESARLTSNRLLEKVLGKKDYSMKIRLYPHHILRENPLAAGAGADRMSTGMARPFGKAIGTAAQVKVGKPILEINVYKKDVELARKACNRAATKLPCKCSIEIIENKI